MQRVKVVYDCHIREVMGYAERGYWFRRGNDTLIIWDGYLSDLMRGMWAAYGWELDPDKPDHPHLGQVPILREWNERGVIDTKGLPIAELAATARAFRAAVAELRRVGPNLADSPQHGEALAAFLEQAMAAGQAVSVEEQWG